MALDAAKLNERRYAELLKLLLDTKRYRKGTKDFQLVVTVDLKDGETPVEVEVEFLAPICYCLEEYPGGMAKLAAEWKRRRKEKDVAKAIEILTAKFASVDAFGPQQLVEFHSSPDDETQAMRARRAYELVQAFLALL